jgi:hypothetical protein
VPPLRLPLVSRGAPPPAPNRETAHAGPGDEDKGHRLARGSWHTRPVAAGCVGPCRRETPVTKDRARKQSIRARMSASGEPYSVAARKLTDDAEPGDVALSLLRDRIDATLAAPSARVRLRFESNLGTRKDIRAKLARFFGDTALKLIVPGMGGSIAGRQGEGFIEPPTGRYQVYWGGYATVVTGGRQFFGRPGEPVEEHPAAPDDDEGEEEEPLLEPLADMRGAASARFSGEDIVRGTPCRVIAAETGSREFTVWVDDVHVRQMSSKSATPSLWGTVTAEVTLELWDFGVATEALDWSRFQGPG